MSTQQAFVGRFAFNKNKAFYVGVEREAFLANRLGHIVPQAQLVLARMASENTDLRELVGYELSACQVETRTRPCEIDALEEALLEPEQALNHVLASLDLHLSHEEVAPPDMPLDVYPDPTGRYQAITRNMPRHILEAACRIIGTHVHIGMPDHETALNVYNRVIGYCPELCSMGDSSNGERLRIYRVMAPEADPMGYTSWYHYHQRAEEKSFAEDPRKCWTLIRISVHGTIEFRMFGTTNSIGRIVRWARFCHARCVEAAQ